MLNKTLCFVDDAPGALLRNEIKYIAEKILDYNIIFFEDGDAIDKAYSYFQRIARGNYNNIFFLIDMDMPINPKLERRWGISREFSDLNGIYLVKKISQEGFPVENIAILTHYPSIKDRLEDYALSSLEKRFFTKYDLNFSLMVKWLAKND